MALADEVDEFLETAAEVFLLLPPPLTLLSQSSRKRGGADFAAIVPASTVNPNYSSEHVMSVQQSTWAISGN